VEAILKQRAMLQVNLVVQNLVVVFRADSEVLVMTQLLLKSLEEEEEEEVVVDLTVILTASLDLHSLEVSVILQVSPRARPHLFLVLTVLADHPVDLGAVLHRLPARLALVAVAILKASLRLIRLVELVALVLPASPAHHPIAEQ
jgi:hypothetical protein